MAWTWVGKIWLYTLICEDLDTWRNMGRGPTINALVTHCWPWWVEKKERERKIKENTGIEGVKLQTEKPGELSVRSFNQTGKPILYLRIKFSLSRRGKKSYVEGRIWLDMCSSVTLVIQNENLVSNLVCSVTWRVLRPLIKSPSVTQICLSVDTA